MSHRDGANGLFIGTSKLLLALMNSAPAELLHHLIHAALQPHLVTSLLLQTSPRVGDEGGPCHALNRRCDSRNQKKRRQQSRRGYPGSRKPTGFSRKKPPFPTKSRPAANTQKSESFVYCSLKLLVVLRFAVVFSEFSKHGDCCLHPLRTVGSRLSGSGLLLIPSSVRLRFDIRSRESQRSCVLFSDRSSRSSMGMDFLLAGTSVQDRFAAHDDSR